MRRTLAVVLAAIALAGCGDKSTSKQDRAGKKGKPKAAPAAVADKSPVRAGDPKSVAFAVAWCTNSDPEVAARTAAADAIQGLGCQAKGLIFYEYFPTTAKDEQGNEREVPDTDREAKVLPAIRELAATVPVIGCRARSLVNGGTMLENTVAVLAIGGDKVACKAARARLEDDRKAVGTSIATQLKEVPDLKLVFALSEMSLSFETKEGVSVEDFIRGILEGAGKGVTLFGGNCLPDEPTDYRKDWRGAQFADGDLLTGHVVAMGIGGPIAVHANHTNEFDASAEPVMVTKATDKWVYELDGKPATDVYRKLRGMKPDEPFTSDSEHPIGVIVAKDKVYLRMVLAEDKDKKGLQFVAAVPVGTKVKILKGGKDPKAILASARDGIVQSLYKAGDAKPLLALISDCCARGGRLRGLGEAGGCEVRHAIAPALSQKGAVPIFGFYAWGELGPIAGPFGGLTCMYQQHTFVSAILTEAK